MRRRLQHALALPLILWGLLCLSGAAGVAVLLRGMHATAVDAAYREADSAAATAEQAMLRAFEMVASLQDLLRVKHSVLGWSYSIAGLELDHHLRRMTQDGRFGVVQVSLTDAAGRMVWSSALPGPARLTGEAAMSLADRDHIRAHLSPEPGGIYVSAPLVGRVSGRWSIQVSEAIGRQAAGDLPEGVGVVSLDPVRLSQALATVAEGPGRRVVVRRLLDGAVLARSAEIEAYLPRPPAPDHPLVVAERQAPRGRLGHRTRGSGRPVIAACRVPEGLPLAVAAVFDREEELRPFRTMAFVILGASLVLAGSGLQLALHWGRRRAAVRTLRVQAERDPLTGLRNRRAMTGGAEELLARAGGPAGEPMAVLLFDLDHFKRINDVHGHEAGDTVLRDVAAALVRNVRRDDLVCRWGGEEIVVLLRGCDRAGATRRAEELRACVASLYADGRGPVPGVTTSIGAAIFPRDGTSLAALVQAADRALYRAKREGRNRVQLAEPPPGQAAPAA
jgi:diguanylate cyclase (GGDEF)-like protein